MNKFTFREHKAEIEIECTNNIAFDMARILSFHASAVELSGDKEKTRLLASTLSFYKLRNICAIGVTADFFPKSNKIYTFINSDKAYQMLLNQMQDDTAVNEYIQKRTMHGVTFSNGMLIEKGIDINEYLINRPMFCPILEDITDDQYRIIKGNTSKYFYNENYDNSGLAIRIK